VEVGFAAAAAGAAGAGDVATAAVERALVAQEQHGEAVEAEHQKAAVVLVLQALGSVGCPISGGRDPSWLVGHQIALDRSSQTKHHLPTR
jgi:hypothetical protein